MEFVSLLSKTTKYDHSFQLKFAMEWEIKQMSTNVAQNQTGVISTKVIVMKTIIVMVNYDVAKIIVNFPSHLMLIAVSSQVIL